MKREIIMSLSFIEQFFFSLMKNCMFYIYQVCDLHRQYMRIIRNPMNQIIKENASMLYVSFKKSYDLIFQNGTNVFGCLKCKCTLLTQFEMIKNQSTIMDLCSHLMMLLQHEVKIFRGEQVNKHNTPFGKN